MIGWLRRLFGQERPPPHPVPAWEPEPPPPVPAWEPKPQPPQRRSEAEIDAVEAALNGLIAAGLRLGPRYEGMDRRAVARAMAEHPEFAVGDSNETLPPTEHSSDALSIGIL
jgi:hypothetical protein